MSKEELLILKYINEYKQLPTKQIFKHFQHINLIKKVLFRKRSAERFSETSINGALWYLNINYDYIRFCDNDETIQITDKGEIVAYSFVIEHQEIWKNRIIGFIFGISTSVIATLIITAIKLLQSG